MCLGADAYTWTTAEEGASPPPPQVTTPNPALPVPTGLLPVVQTRQITAATSAAVVVATVNAPTREDLRLEAQIRLASNTIWESMSVATETLEAVSGVRIDGETYSVRARFRTAGAAGAWCAEEAIVITANPTAPVAPTDFTTDVTGDDVTLTWLNPADNFFRSRVFRSNVNSFGGAVAIAVVSGLANQPSTFVDAGPSEGTWYYWVVALNESNIASTPVGPQSVTIP